MVEHLAGLGLEDRCGLLAQCLLSSRKMEGPLGTFTKGSGLDFGIANETINTGTEIQWQD